MPDSLKRTPHRAGDDLPVSGRDDVDLRDLRGRRSGPGQGREYTPDGSDQDGKLGSA